MMELTLWEMAFVVTLGSNCLNEVFSRGILGHYNYMNAALTPVLKCL